MEGDNERESERAREGERKMEAGWEREYFEIALNHLKEISEEKTHKMFLSGRL